MKRKITGLLLSLCLLLLCLPSQQVQASDTRMFRYSIRAGCAVIEGCYDEGAEGSDLVIPEIVDGYLVSGIANSAFLGCDWLTSVTLPSSLEYIEEAAFHYCQNLTSVTIPASVREIEWNAFSGCTGLMEIRVDENNSVFCSDAQGGLYTKDGLALVQAPGGFVGEYVIPDGVRELSWGAFQGCQWVTNIRIPQSVTRIEGYAFYECQSLTRLELPKWVDEIGDNSFDYCTNLQFIQVDPQNRRFCSDQQGFLYNKEGTELLCVPGAVTGGFSVPQGVTRLGNSFMEGCDGVTSVTVPEGVTEIGHYAFYGCENLTSVSLPSTLTAIDAYAFEQCTALMDIQIPESVTSIEVGLFLGCTSLTTLPVHDRVTRIEALAFHSCTGLTDITIPASVSSIGHYAFYDCRGLKEIRFIGDAPEFTWDGVHDGAFTEVMANAWYDPETNGWTEQTMLSAGGYLTWAQIGQILPQQPTVQEDDHITKAETTGDPGQGILRISEFRVVGNASWMGNGDPASDLGRMIQIEPGKYQKRFQNVPAGTYELRITENGTWERSWGDGDDNYCVTVAETCDLEITFLYDGNQGTIQVKDYGPDTGDVGVVVSVVLLLSTVALVLIASKRKWYIFTKSNG